MKVSKTLFGIVVVFILTNFVTNPVHAKKECEELVWEGDYEIQSLGELEVISGYTKVTGNLSIMLSDLTSLEGLECLSEIGGDLSIENNEFLTRCFSIRDLIQQMLSKSERRKQ